MSGPLQALYQTMRRLWFDKDSASEPTGYKGVIVHDPAAQGPHDLDDPFFERDVQARVAQVIASAVETDQKK